MTERSTYCTDLRELPEGARQCEDCMEGSSRVPAVKAAPQVVPGVYLALLRERFNDLAECGCHIRIQVVTRTFVRPEPKGSGRF